MHNIELKTIRSKSLKEGDIFVITYEVGEATPSEANVALNQLREVFRKIVPEGVEIVVLATRNGKEDVSLKIIKDKTQE